MSHFIDLSKKRYGRLTVLERDLKSPYKGTYWKCKCDCGCLTSVKSGNLKNGLVKSCGCLKHESHNTHHKSDTKLYKIWRGMLNRCYNQKTKSYKNYGGRGIIICDNWKNSFEAFYNWAINNGYCEGLSIERINNNKNYCPENCKWIPLGEQARNRRKNYSFTISGITKDLADWCKQYNMNYYLVHNRIYKLNWYVEKALITPCNTTKRNKKAHSDS